MRRIRPLLVLAALLATTPVLSAQTVVRTQTRVDRMVVAQGPVTIDEARYIAARSGITLIEDIDFDKWRQDLADRGSRLVRPRLRTGNRRHKRPSHPLRA